MHIEPGTTNLDDAKWNDPTRRKSAHNEIRFAENLRHNVFERHLARPTEALITLLLAELTRLAASSLPEARSAALAAWDDPAAADVFRDYLTPLAQLLDRPPKGVDTRQMVRDAGDLLRMVGTAYETATQRLERRFVDGRRVLTAIEKTLDDDGSVVNAQLALSRLLDGIPSGNRAEARATLLRIARFGQAQGAFRDGFAARVLDFDGTPKQWWSLDAFNARTNRMRMLRDVAAQHDKYPISSAINVLWGFLSQPFGSEPQAVEAPRDQLIERAGRYRWVVLPSSVLFWVSRFFGLSEGGDISGTTADAIFVLEALLAQPEALAVRQHWGEDLSLIYLLPLVQMVEAQHHSLLEIGYALTLNDISDYVISDYQTLLPKGASRTTDAGRAFLETAEEESPPFKLYFDGTDRAGIEQWLAEGYPSHPEPGDRSTNLGDLTSAIGPGAEIWTMESLEEAAAYRQVASVRRSQYRMFAEFRTQRDLSHARVTVAALAHSRGAAMNRLDLIRLAAGE